MKKKTLLKADTVEGKRSDSHVEQHVQERIHPSHGHLRSLYPRARLFKTSILPLCLTKSASLGPFLLEGAEAT